MNTNLILLSDSYKVSHWRQYPPRTDTVYSYFEARRGGEWKQTMFFGLQYQLLEYLQYGITQDDISEANDLFKLHFGTDSLFNRAGWDHILRKHGGNLPVSIKAVPEGTIVNNSNVLMTIENTDPEVPWITNFLETLLVQCWYPCTVATLSNQARQVILKYLKETGNPDLIGFKLHDFGCRGVSSMESAGIGGCAHLVNFVGTDTLPPLVFANKYYDCEMAGFSVPAAEHSTMTAWGQSHEVDAYRNMIQQYGDQPFYSVVSDSYDLYNAARNIWGSQLREEVLNAPGTLVVRPDSGNPVVIVPTLLKLLASKFGSEVNEKGFRVLHPKVRVIQGDGMDLPMIGAVLQAMKDSGYSADNVVFGMGGGLLQKVNRDTQRFAFKCASVTVNGEEREVWKNPATDNMKVSKRGRMSLVPFNGNYKTVTGENAEGDILTEVFRDGEILKKYTLEEVRANAGVLTPALVD